MVHFVAHIQSEGTESNCLSGSRGLPSAEEPPSPLLPLLMEEDYHCSCDLGEQNLVNTLEGDLRLSDLEDNPCPQVANIIVVRPTMDVHVFSSPPSGYLPSCTRESPSTPGQDWISGYRIAPLAASKIPPTAGMCSGH